MNIDEQFYKILLDSLANPIAFVDTDHVIRYLNRAALSHYTKGRALVGTSIFDCHNAASNEIIRRIYDKMGHGLDEELITDNEKHRIFMRAVRDDTGALIGYFERYEPPRNASDQPPKSDNA